MTTRCLKGVMEIVPTFAHIQQCHQSIISTLIIG